MPKDLKIGLIVGLVLVVIAAIWMASRPQLGTESPVLTNQQEDSNIPVRYVTELPHSSNSKSEPDSNSYKKSEISSNSTQRFYIVKEGETLSEISRRYYGTTDKVENIVRANRIENPNQIKPGTKLILPE